MSSLARQSPLDQSFSSGRQPPIIFLLQAAPAIPERRRLLARCAGCQNLEMHVPAGANLEQGRAIGNAAMNDREQYPVADGLQFKGDVTAALPGDGELAGRIKLGDAGLHPVLVAE